ncbi:MAG: flavin reductase family protein [Bacteroidetes bacterium]|nr:flavin reductase family protein [Bacteroidota bacterium]
MKEKVSFGPDKRAWKPSPLVGQIVLVTTLNADGQSNIAPKSWISMMAFEPSLLALGCNRSHWTAQNILRSREFVVNIPGEELAEIVWSTPMRPHPRPVPSVGLTPIPAQKVKPPLVEECKAHLECVLNHQLTFGDEIMFLGEVVAGSVDKAALESRDPYTYLKMVVFLEDRTFGVIEKGQQIREKTTPPSIKTRPG